ncbi:MAG: hypothetical protein HC927_10430 [Deltaproteobacteria bacterium]|nr:hypothetical protein [Deltaproteobacteria bacterium]
MDDTDTVAQRRLQVNDPVLFATGIWGEGVCVLSEVGDIYCGLVEGDILKPISRGKNYLMIAASEFGVCGSGPAGQACYFIGDGGRTEEWLHVNGPADSIAIKVDGSTAFVAQSEFSELAWRRFGPSGHETNEVVVEWAAGILPESQDKAIWNTLMIFCIDRFPEDAACRHAAEVAHRVAGTNSVKLVLGEAQGCMVLEGGGIACFDRHGVCYDASRQARDVDISNGLTCVSAHDGHVSCWQRIHAESPCR